VLCRSICHDVEANELRIRRGFASGYGVSCGWRSSKEIFSKTWITKEERSGGRILLLLQLRKAKCCSGGDKEAESDESRASAENPDDSLEIGGPVAIA
jgi:hypothetical protein